MQKNNNILRYPEYSEGPPSLLAAWVNRANGREKRFSGRGVKSENLFEIIPHTDGKNIGTGLLPAKTGIGT